MRSKAPLAMMEQMVMLLVFALAAALCLQAFVKSDEISRRSEARDQAVVAAQNAAETIKCCGGNTENALSRAAEMLDGVYLQGVLIVDYTSDWSYYPDEGEEAFHLTAEEVSSDVPGLRKALVSVWAIGNEEPLIERETAWQEVDGNG